MLPSCIVPLFARVFMSLPSPGTVRSAVTGRRTEQTLSPSVTELLA